ncbi:hypothetical protein H0H87_007523 [Tephrocybe sp. NHM501043]|nr:hypothetical protein H0H87_007523 [Tephrocybe sp. NHM501043]
MTGFTPLPIENAHSTQKFTGKAFIVGPKWSHLPVITIGLLGVQIFWSVEMGYASPYLLSLGLSKSAMSLVFLAGPLSGLFMQPIIGVLADASTSRFGRRRPFMMAGTVVCVLSMLLLGYTRDFASLFTTRDSSTNTTLTIALAVLSIYIIDFSINAVMAMDRALLVDTLPPAAQSSGNAWAARMLGIGAVVGFFVETIPLPRIFPFLGTTELEVYGIRGGRYDSHKHHWFLLGHHPMGTFLSCMSIPLVCGSFSLTLHKLAEAILTTPDPTSNVHNSILLTDARTPAHDPETAGETAVFLGNSDEHRGKASDDESDLGEDDGDPTVARAAGKPLSIMLGNQHARVSRIQLDDDDAEWEDVGEGINDGGGGGSNTGGGGLSAKAGIILFLVTGLSAVIFAIFDPVQPQAHILPPPPRPAPTGIASNVTEAVVRTALREVGDLVTKEEMAERGGQSNSVVYIFRWVTKYFLSEVVSSDKFLFLFCLEDWAASRL